MNKPSLFFRQAKQKWYLQIPRSCQWPKGKQIDLGVSGEKLANGSATNRPLALKEAKKRWKKLKRELHDDTPGNPQVVDLIDRFLECVKPQRAERTHEFYERHLGRLKDWIQRHFNGRLTVQRLKRKHIQEWVEECYVNSGAADRGGAIRAAKRVFSWAETEAELIKVNPIRGMKAPACPAREICLTEADWQRVVGEIGSGSLLDILTFLRLTGARPVEARTAQKHHFKDNCLEFERRNSKGKRSPRVIPLGKAAMEIVERLAAKTDSAIFKNTKGQPWTRGALNHACEKISHTLKMPFYPYALRHTWASDAQVKGIADTTIAACMGHSNTQMLSTTYGHVKLKRQHLRDVMDRMDDVA
ncbi:MAG TPA: tyrosine-type recombinase/integrase [Pirellulales bacterium]|jgi:integrase|nr:tyrosine-type recombinase/integrase [Pirellulales bacterium]